MKYSKVLMLYFKSYILNSVQSLVGNDCSFKTTKLSRWNERIGLIFQKKSIPFQIYYFILFVYRVQLALRAHGSLRKIEWNDSESVESLKLYSFFFSIGHTCITFFSKLSLNKHIFVLQYWN